MTAATAATTTMIGQRRDLGRDPVAPHEASVDGPATGAGVPPGVITKFDGVGAAMGLEPLGVAIPLGSETGICPLGREPPVPSTRNARSAWRREAGEKPARSVARSPTLG